LSDETEKYHLRLAKAENILLAAALDSALSTN